VSGSADNTVKLWALQDRQCIHTFTEHTDQVCFLTSGKFKQFDNLFLCSQVWGVKFSSDGKKILSVSEDKTINIYEYVVPEEPEEPSNDISDMYN